MNKILIGIVTIIILFFAYGFFENSTKKSMKSKRVECQNKTTTFEQINKSANITTAQNLLQSGNYTIKSNIEYSKLMPTVLINYFDIKKVDELLVKNIPLKENINSDKKLLVDYYIYENDKEDTNKKNDKAKLYAGYLVFEFKFENKTLYKIQSDYMKQDGSDIEDRMKCIIKSFLTIKGE